MKRLKRILLALLICATAFNSCKKSTTKPLLTVGLSFKVDGALKSLPIVHADWTLSNLHDLIIEAKSGSERIYLTVRGYTVGSPNEYSPDNMNLIYSNGENSLSYFYGLTGNITVTSIDSNSVTGTFEFTSMNSSKEGKSITSGQFHANMITQ